MAEFRKWFAAINDLYTAYSWVLSATTWALGSGSVGIVMNQVAAWAGASPLQAITYGMAAALLTTNIGILWRLYALNKPMAKLEVLPPYMNDFGTPIGSINFTGIGSPIRLEMYCIDIRVLEPGNDRLEVPANKPGKMFTLHRTEPQHVEIIRFENLPLTPIIHVTAPTKHLVSDTLRGSKFGLSVVAYAGLLNERINVQCWIDKQKNELHWEVI